MSDRYLVDTPESIELAYDVAGIGSRFLAATVDTLLIGLAQALTIYLLSLATGVSDLTDSVFAAISAGLSFLILWGYYIAFELAWSGQTPGKRLLGLRVVREGGRPITFLAAAIRNVVRLADFLPLMYGLGVVVMFADRRARRLGDFAAGTLVVRERGGVTLASLTRAAAPEAAAEPTLANIDLVAARDYALVQEFLERRAELGRDVRTRVAAQLAGVLQTRLGVEPGDPETFLQTVAREYRMRRAALQDSPAA